jgi:type II secretion system protein N
MGWVIFFLVALVAFTLFKLPQDRLKLSLLSQVNQQLASLNLELQAETGGLKPSWSLLKYEMTGVSLRKLGDSQGVRFESMELRPRLLLLLKGLVGGGLEAVTLGGGKLLLEGGFSGSRGIARLQLSEIDLKKTPVLGLFTKFQATGTLNGSLELEGNPSEMASWSGIIEMKVLRLILDKQSFMGFSIPEAKIAVSDLNFRLEPGKWKLEKVQLGSANSADDLSLQLTGELTPKSSLSDLSLNLRVSLGLSKKILEEIPLLDTLMSQAKAPSGLYGYQLTGTPMSPQFLPKP